MYESSGEETWEGLPLIIMYIVSWLYMRVGYPNFRVQLNTIHLSSFGRLTQRIHKSRVVNSPGVELPGHQLWRGVRRGSSVLANNFLQSLLISLSG